MTPATVRLIEEARRRGEVITLHLKKEYWDKILSGEKREEYRSSERYREWLKGKTIVEFALGYPSRRDTSRWAYFLIQGTKSTTLKEYAGCGFWNTDLEIIYLGKRLM